MSGFMGTPGRFYGSTLKDIVNEVLEAPLPTWDGTHVTTKVCNLGHEHEVTEVLPMPEFVVFKDVCDWNVGYAPQPSGWEQPLAWIPRNEDGEDFCDWTPAEAEAVMHLLKARWDSLRDKASSEPEDELIGMYRTTYDTVNGVGRRREVLRKSDDGTGYVVRFPDDNDPQYEGFYSTIGVHEYIEDGEWVKIV
jgi:hypothetical protein